MDTKITILIGILVVATIVGIYLKSNMQPVRSDRTQQLSTEIVEQSADQALEQELTYAVETQNTTDLENALLV